MKTVKMTPKIVDHIRELSTAGLNSTEINCILDREYGMTKSRTTIADIVNGHLHDDKGSFSEEYKKHLNDVIDGVDTEKPVELPRLEKFGILYGTVTMGIDKTIEHYNSTINAKLTKESVDEIVKEVNGWIEKNELRDENEEWFKSRILEKNNDSVKAEANTESSNSTSE